MKNMALLFLLTAGISACALTADTPKEQAPATQPAVKLANTKCPISGDPVDPAVTVTQDGKVVGFCCKDCIDEFKKNPGKYMKKLQ